MTRLSLAGCVLLLLLPAGRVWAELSCIEATHDAGQVASGNVIRHPFRLTNQGTSVIEITEVKPGCGCLRPHLDHPTLQPGEGCTLTLEINTLTQAGGANLWRAVVHYRDNGQARELPVQVCANLLPGVAVQPSTLLIHTQTAARGEFTLSEQLGRPLTIRAAVTGSPHIRVGCWEPVRDGAGWKRTIVLEVLPGLPEGRLEDVVKVFTDNTTYPELSVPFTVIKHSADRVQVSPQSLNLAVLGDSALPSRIVSLCAGDDRPVVVERVETSSSFIRCTHAQGPGPRTTLRLQFDRDSMPAEKTFEAAVRVHVREPSPQVLTIPVHCTRP
jgi:hypothetical protein